jgi:ribosomal protein L34E
MTGTRGAEDGAMSEKPKCHICGRTLTGTYETTNGICASILGCTDRKRAKEAAQSKAPRPKPKESR